MISLQNKTAVIYGAGGSVGAAVARAFANAGAKVFLTGRNLGCVQHVADEIIASGGSADAAGVDALNERDINTHLDSVLHKAGSVDISFNLIGVPVIQNIPLIDMAASDFTQPVTNYMQTHFLTASASGRIMKQQGSGVILSLTATPGGIGYPLTGSFGVACAAMESFYRTLASELGVYGIRAANIRSGGSPDSKVFKEAIANNPDVMDAVLKKMENDTMLKRMPPLADITNTAVFLASDMAGSITGVTVDVTCGTTVALNYRTGS